MNEHDSEKVAGLLAHHGMVAVNSPEEADLFLLNTCSVREKASQKMYSRLGEIKKQKNTNPEFLIGVLGCVAQQESEALANKAPFVDLVVGTHMVHALPDLLEEIEQERGRGTRVATDFMESPAPVEIPQVIRQSSFRANITIMEGCNKHCSFCIVPYTRGRERNRPATAVIDEARRAVDQGFVEILLLGQTVNSYKDPHNRCFKFADLLREIASIAGVQRVRFTSPHPREFDDDCISVIAEMETICNQVHLPVQSGSNPILKRMRRQYTRERYLELVDKFRDCGRSIALSTDIIVGFIGEKEADFQETLSLVEEVQFESMFSFKYSPRPETEAQHFEGDLPEEKKTRRIMALQHFQKGIQLRLHHQHYLGHCMSILVEGAARDGVRRYGRTTTNKIVNFPGDDQPGTFTDVLITDVGPNSMVGKKVQGIEKNQGEQAYGRTRI